MEHPTLELVASYNDNSQYGGTQHFSEHGDYRTLCGRNRENWMVLRKADLTSDIENAWTCKRCIKKLTD